MSKRSDNIPIRRNVHGQSVHSTERDEGGVYRQGERASSAQQGKPEPNVDAIRKRIIITALLLGLLAVLLLIALVSYTVKDEANAQLSMKDIFGVIRGDNELRNRFESTHNWLGLLGAVASQWMYSATVGMWSVSFPILMLFWARDLLRFQKITPLVTRRSIAVIGTAVLVSAIFSTAQLIFPSVDAIFCGAIGQFIAGTSAQFVGTAGTSLILIVTLGFVVVFGFDVQPRSVFVFSKLALARIRNIFASQNKTRTDADAAAAPDSVIRPKIILQDEDSSDTLSPTVKIVRQTPGAQKLDPDVVRERLQRLHSVRSAAADENMPGVRGPSEPGDVPELPLFIKDDEDDALPVEIPEGALPRPLTINVESAHPEEEVKLSSSTLYDEHIVYKLPPASLLIDIPDESIVDDDELQENARILQEKLETFRVRIENLTVQPGPVVTQYEFVPASGVKVAQIESLADDIALALKAQGVRIIAPIPGRGTVGIEIPNHHPSVVRFSSIIKSPKYHNPDVKLPIAMGKTVVGEVYCTDLTKMPHLLIAGATGKGKSVGINTIIASLLYRMHPRDLKFVIIDPKRVEMTLYKTLKNHFLALCPDIDETIITEPQNAVTVLKSVVEEMQGRYSILAAAGQRNISDYNRKAKDGSLRDRGGITHRPMPYIVVIIDELADLMMTASKEVEDPIVRLAQLARAVGIHCVVATQRPSVDVVTGLIKANFPARIAYQVASRIDSRTILDGSGAEHLIGNGDMLFAPGNTPKPIRMQNAFISTEEVEAICEHIGKQRGYSQPYMLPSIKSKRSDLAGGSGDRDILFEDAARIFIQLQQASVSTLQRRLKIGYARAARIVDELEMAGIVGPPDGSKGRAVLLQSESELEAYL
ncbi:MAG: DNA translocase FtsK 4TM domain-containing protein [Ignavibacteria bacterium]|nr:DNA translocase FtsK 4TM domain-containing protein [Ignavibacteria bacterium]